jgi:hypothetical protein
MALGPAAGLVLPAVLFALCAGGCSSWKVMRVARFDPGRSAPNVQRPAPDSAAYQVKYAGPGGRLHTLGGTKRIVARGEPLGFSAAPDGTIVALAGDDQIPLDNLPPSARYCVWTHKERRPTQFTREVGKASETTLLFVALGSLKVAEIYLESEFADDDDCDDSDRDRKTHRRRRAPRWVGPNPSAAPAPQTPTPVPPR